MSDSVPTDERWELGARIGRYRCVPATPQEQTALSALGKVEFEAISIGRRGEGPQVAIIPLDEASVAHARLVVKAPELWEAVKLILPMVYDRLPISVQFEMEDLLKFVGGKS